jgi:hypothetical protein
MAEDYTQSEAKLRKLATRLRRGWAKLHPATKKELAAVREEVREQWKQDREILKRIAESKRGKEAARTEARPKAQKLRGKPAKSKKTATRRRSWGHDRGR